MTRQKDSYISCFKFELLDEVVDKMVVEIFFTKMGITSSGLYFENTLLNSKGRYIESSSAKIEDEDVTFTSKLLAETIGDRSSRGLLMIRRTFIPEMVPVSLVACLESH